MMDYLAVIAATPPSPEDVCPMGTRAVLLLGLACLLRRAGSERVLSRALAQRGGDAAPQDRPLSPQ